MENATRYDHHRALFNTPQPQCLGSSSYWNVLTGYSVRYVSRGGFSGVRGGPFWNVADATRRFGAGRWLARGPLSERVERIEQAFMVSATGIDARLGRDPACRGSVRSTRARPPKGGRPPKGRVEVAQRAGLLGLRWRLSGRPVIPEVSMALRASRQLTFVPDMPRVVRNGPRRQPLGEEEEVVPQGISGRRRHQAHRAVRAAENGARQVLDRRQRSPQAIVLPVAGHFLNGRFDGGEVCGAGIYDRGAGTEFDPVLDHDVPVAKRRDRVAKPLAEHIARLESCEERVRREVHDLEVAGVEPARAGAEERWFVLVALVNGTEPREFVEADGGKLASASVIQLNEPRMAVSAAVTKASRRSRECSPAVSISSGDFPSRSTWGALSQWCSFDVRSTSSVAP